MTGADDPTAESVEAALAVHGTAWWRRWEPGALRSVCDRVPVERLRQRPQVARWRALASVMQEEADALGCLELAFEGHRAQGDDAAASLDARIALVCCLIDGGTMSSIEPWLIRAGGDAAAGDGEPTFWSTSGDVAMSIFGRGEEERARTAADWLFAQLAPLRTVLAPNERLIAAQVLISRYMAAGQFARFDQLANAVGEPAAFDMAAPVMRGRWLHTLGFAHYHAGSLDRAEGEWRQALEIAAKHGLPQLGLLSSLALLRLMLDRGRLDEAAHLRAALQPRWGSGRHAQLMYLHQMDARLAVLNGQPTRALASIEDALALANDLGLSDSEQASCLTDLSQILVANRRLDEAVGLLGRLAASHPGRDGVVFSCLQDLLRGWRRRLDDLESARTHLAAGLAKAAEIRYAMFFRLLPAVAGEVCADALRWDIEPVMVRETVRARDLPAPVDAGSSWPWAVWLRLLGPCDILLRGVRLAAKPGRKSPKKPIELLQLLGSEPGLSLPLADAADALWPESEGDLARKSLDMTIQRLRRLLEDDDNRWVVVDDGRVQLAARHVASDVAIRRRLLLELEQCALDEAPFAALAAQLRSVVECSTGPLLKGASEAAWCEDRRRRMWADSERVVRTIRGCRSVARAPVDDRAAIDALLSELQRRSA